MGFSDDLVNSTLNRVFRNISNPLTAPYPPLDLALWIGDPAGGGGNEVSGAGYARVLTSTGDWTMATNGTVSNQSVLTFAEATGAWGIVSHFAIIGAVERVILAFGSIQGGPFSIVRGSVPRFDVGDLEVTLN